MLQNDLKWGVVKNGIIVNNVKKTDIYLFLSRLR
jgi:hypothetical protein